jgi:hypothetical protein
MYFCPLLPSLFILEGSKDEKVQGTDNEAIKHLNFRIPLFVKFNTLPP